MTLVAGYLVAQEGPAPLRADPSCGTVEGGAGDDALFGGDLPRSYDLHGAGRQLRPTNALPRVAL